MSETIYDLNSLTSDSPIVFCLKIEIPDTPTVYVTSDNIETVYGGNTYQPFPFQLSELTHGTSGELPEVTIQMSNINRVMEAYLHQYDAYLKANGIDGNEIKATIYIVNTKTSEAVHTEYLKFESANTDWEWASFKLGSNSPFTWRFPPRRIIQNFCGHKFKNNFCKYSGSVTSCDKTLTTCRILGNGPNFGAFAGIGKGIRV